MLQMEWTSNVSNLCGQSDPKWLHRESIAGANWQMHFAKSIHGYLLSLGQRDQHHIDNAPQVSSERAKRSNGHDSFKTSGRAELTDWLFFNLKSAISFLE